MGAGPICPRCGRYVCAGISYPYVCPEYENIMSLRDKTIKPEPTSESLAWKAGKEATKWDVESYLTAYIGDDFFARKFVDCMDLIKKKNADYSQGEQKGDRIAAFRRIARDTEISMQKVWYVFFSKHIGAIVKYVKSGIVESEVIDGRVDDAINYLILLAAIIEDEKKDQKAP